jgi:catechol 2,3-dioxygenase-like lactoylglutathione lyase family enzyme
MARLIARAHPILASLDFDRTVAFYERLGFAATLRLDNYVIVRREDIELHFWKCDDRNVAENTSCYLDTIDVDALHAEFIANGVKATPLANREWGRREFYVIDSSGNLLRFGQRIASPAS